MPFPAPVLSMVHGVLHFPAPTEQNPARDERLIDAVRAEFPNVINRQYLPPTAPPSAPHLILSSTSSQLALSSIQTDFEVRFYGDYLNDIERALDYVGRKLSAVLAGITAMDIQPMLVGVVASVRFAFPEGDERPTDHILRTHLRLEADGQEVQDAMARVAVQVRDTYFVTLTVSNYESRVIERPIFAGQRSIAIRPWEGRVDEVGIELGVDINNGLEARSSDGEIVVTETGVRAVLGLLREVTTHAGPTFAEDGTLAIPELAASSTR